MPYVDGFVIPVPTTKRDAYVAHESKWWPFFKDHGALSLLISWGDEVPAGKQTDFRRAVALKDDETVVFGVMTWPDKETRNAAFAAMESNPLASEMMEMPFDGKRMIYGGFTPVLMEGIKS